MGIGNGIRFLVAIFLRPVSLFYGQSQHALVISLIKPSQAPAPKLQHTTPISTQLISNCSVQWAINRHHGINGISQAIKGGMAASSTRRGRWKPNQVCGCRSRRIRFFSWSKIQREWSTWWARLSFMICGSNLRMIQRSTRYVNVFCSYFLSLLNTELEYRFFRVDTARAEVSLLPCWAGSDQTQDRRKGHYRRSTWCTKVGYSIHVFYY